MRKIAIIVAGGVGLRMGMAKPKQFVELKGKSLLWHTINTFLSSFDDMELVIVLHKDYLDIGTQLKKEFSTRTIKIISGGASRFESVQNGLKCIDEENCIVFVHDAVRCLISTHLIKSCYEQAVVKGSAIPAVVATDSIRISTGNEISYVADRNNVFLVQTPQTFQSNIIKQAFNQPYQESFTDEASVVEATGQKVFLINGEYNNIKITRPLDLVTAEKILEERISIIS